MPRCTHLGCQKEYEEAENSEGSCSYHSGGPVFHEGLKSWSCCNTVSKPVLEFDQFMAIPPCTTGTHTSVKPANAAPSAGAASTAPTSYVNDQGVEVYGSAPPKAPAASESASTSAPAPAVAAAPTPQPAKPVVVEEDDLEVPVPEGAKCKRLACGKAWEGEDVSRGDGEAAKCRHHPQGAIFHEGSKGYLCCKRRVLEFDEFMKIEGCTIGKHLFVGPKKDESKEEVVTCRIDHYQTPLTVHVSAFAKSADKSRSTVKFGAQELILDLYLPGNKRINKTLTLYGPIAPEECTFRILGTKVEIVLKKPGAASWPLLELPAVGAELPKGYALTFGVSGRTGTVGGKEIVLAPEEIARRAEA